MDLLKMALDAGFDVHPRKKQIRSPFDYCANDITGIVEKFAHAVASAEREECALIAEQHEEGPGGAEAIRMRSNIQGKPTAANKQNEGENT